MDGLGRQEWASGEAARRTGWGWCRRVSLSRCQCGAPWKSSICIRTRPFWPLLQIPRKLFLLYWQRGAFKYCYTLHKYAHCSLVRSILMEFAVTRLFMKMFKTGSPTIIIDCQRYFTFLPIIQQLFICIAKFFSIWECCLLFIYRFGYWLILNWTAYFLLSCAVITICNRYHGSYIIYIYIFFFQVFVVVRYHLTK